jgi:hypothetical protein
MNRLAPLIVRSHVRRGPARVEAIALPPEEAGFADDLRLFTTAFVGGLIFFGTFLA